MATARDVVRESALAPEPFGLIAVFLIGLAAVLFLPTLAPHLPPTQAASIRPGGR